MCARQVEMTLAFDAAPGGEDCDPLVDIYCGSGQGGPGGELDVRYNVSGSRVSCGTGPLLDVGGTSSAAPHVSAALATMLTHIDAQDLEGPQLARILRHTTRKITEDSPLRLLYAPLTLFSDFMGYGLVDAEAAALAAGELETWPADPRSLTATRSGTGVSLSWTNPAAPSGGYQLGEYAGALVIRYDGNVWDQSVWPRSPSTTELTGLWIPSDGVPLLAGTSPITGVELLEVDDVNTFVDTSADRDATYTYAVYIHNSNNYYSFPAFTVAPARKRHLIPPVGSPNVTGGVSYDDPAVMIESVIGLEVEGDAAPRCGSADGDAWIIPPAASAAEELEMVFDLEDYCQASLIFDEIVEVFGFAYAGRMHCELLAKRDTDMTWTTLIRDHTSITFDVATGKYVWRAQDVSLDAFCGSEVTLLWRVDTAGFNMPLATSLGWLVDNIEVRGEPACPADLDRNGVINSADYAELMGSWNATFSFCDESDADLNRNGVVNSADMAELLGSYGECEGCGGEEMMRGGGLAAPVAGLLAALEFETLEGYVEWFDGLEPGEQVTHMSVAVAILGALE